MVQAGDTIEITTRRGAQYFTVDYVDDEGIHSGEMVIIPIGKRLQVKGLPGQHRVMILPKPTPEELSGRYISGPKSLSEHYSPEYDMHIYLFGESHHSTLCRYNLPNTPVDKLLLDLVEKDRRVQFDLFLELPYLTRPSRSQAVGSRSMGKIKDTFSGCFDYDKTRCEHPNLRAHYADFRLCSYGVECTEFGRLLMRIIQPIISSYQEERVDLQTLIAILSSSQESSLDLLIKLSDINGKLEKQLENTRIQVPLIDFFQNKIPTREELLERTIAAAEELERSQNFEQWIDQNGEFLFMIMKWQSVLLDIYILARIFRGYHEVSGRYSGYAKNIIVYLGDSHSQVEREFLSYLGFRLIQQTEAENGCIDISRFTSLDR